MSPADLYEQDFYEWTVRNAELLRSGRASEADLEHIAEEIEDMGKREKKDLRSRLSILITHLLKCQVQPERKGRSWLLTIRAQRMEIRKLLDENPSMRPFMADILAEAYDNGLLMAI